jgi:hypothetical protein
MRLGLLPILAVAGLIKAPGRGNAFQQAHPVQTAVEGRARAATHRPEKQANRGSVDTRLALTVKRPRLLPVFSPQKVIMKNRFDGLASCCQHRLFYVASQQGRGRLPLRKPHVIRELSEDVRSRAPAFGNRWGSRPKSPGNDRVSDDT